MNNKKNYKNKIFKFLQHWFTNSQNCARKLRSRTEHLKHGLCWLRLHHESWETSQLFKWVLKRVSFLGCTTQTEQYRSEHMRYPRHRMFWYRAKADAHLENITSAGARSNVLCRNKTSVENFLGKPRECSVLHYTPLHLCSALNRAG